MVESNIRVLQSDALLLGRKPNSTKGFLARHQGTHVNMYGRTDMMVTMAAMMIIPHHMCATFCRTHMRVW